MFGYCQSSDFSVIQVIRKIQRQRLKFRTSQWAARSDVGKKAIFLDCISPIMFNEHIICTTKPLASFRRNQSQTLADTTSVYTLIIRLGP